MSKDKLDEALQGTLNYLIRVGDATSQLFNVTVLFGENANESVSGRAYRMSDTSKGWRFTRAALDFVLNDDHCETAYLNDVARAAKTLNDSKKKNKK